jgi:hypothetical protein
MLLSAVSDAASGTLTTISRYGPSKPLSIQRRQEGASEWTLLATNYFPPRFTNSDLSLGHRYEFKVGNEYLLSGIAAAPVEARGKILLIIEKQLVKEAGPEIALLKADLIGDGWTVVSTNVPRHDDQVWSKNIPVIASIKAFITNSYYADPERTKAVYLVGHVPIPYSGFHNPDGHGARALPADLYYGDVDGIYTDSRVHYASFLEGAHLLRHDNLIGDGKFDQIGLAENARNVAELELAVGRADFAGLGSFAPLTESDLAARYIQKTHRYRFKELEFPDRIMVTSVFPTGPNRLAYIEALKVSSRLFGSDLSHIAEGDAFNTDNSALWGVLGGFGLPFAVQINGAYHQTLEMTTTNREPRLGFVNVFASYCFDYDYSDNLLRAFLATPTYGLGAMWFRPIVGDRIPISFEALGMGEPIATGFVRSINQSQLENAPNTYITWLGDPTLRMQIVSPPGNATVSQSAGGIEWTPSADPDCGYLVYRSTTGIEGPWLRITQHPISETKYNPNSVPLGSAVWYQVRAAKMITTGSGSFINLSQGLFFQVGSNDRSDKDKAGQ